MFNLNDIHKITSILSPAGLIEHFKKLLGAYEEKVEENGELKNEITELKDRLRKLIGEQEIPKFKPKKKPKDLHHAKPPKKDRKKNWKKKPKNDAIKIDREERCPVDKENLPSDAEYKGTREVIIQNVIIKTDNVKFNIERWYSPSQKKYYEGKLPPGFQGSQFGPGLRSLVVMLYVGLRSTENKIEKFFTDLGVNISAGEISSILINVPSKMSEEMYKAKETATRLHPFAHIDATGMLVGRINCYNLCHGNDLFSFHTTVPDRGRHEAIKSLIMTNDPIYILNNEAIEWIGSRKILNNKELKKLKLKISIGRLSSSEIEEIVLALELYDKKKSNIVKTGALLSSLKTIYKDILPEVLISDAAGEYKEILSAHQECWIHELRHYREIRICSDYIKEELDQFFEKAWGLFDLMESYKFYPSKELRIKIESDFDLIFKKEYHSFMINHCRANTLSRRAGLLRFLDYPLIPIHNNQVESYIREKVVRRKISGGHKNDRGAAAGNMWISLYQTVRKNGVSFLLYLQDRFNDLNQIAQLSVIIELRA
jgi:regulator of replication initiation timing